MTVNIASPFRLFLSSTCFDLGQFEDSDKDDIAENQLYRISSQSYQSKIMPQMQPVKHVSPVLLRSCSCSTGCFSKHFKNSKLSLTVPKPFLMYKSLMMLICLGQPWYLPPCPTVPGFLSLLISVHHLGDVRLLLFGMRVVMLVLS
jgi:hypothetical protein